MDDLQWFTDQVKQYEQAMYRLAMSILCNCEDAADAAQEAIFIAYQKLDTLRQRDAFRPWLMKILTHECYAILRKKRNLIPLDEIQDLPTSSPSEESLQLWQAVGALSQSLRSVVVLYYYDGFSGKEIASILGISEASVKMRLSRARKLLKTILEESE